MSLFGRRAARPGPTAAAPAERIGRKLSSTAGIDQCVADFRAAVTHQTGVAPRFFEARWCGPSPAPERVVGVVAGGAATHGGPPVGAMYLALWDNGLMHFVVPDYAARPAPPLIEVWKERDSSLCSVGSVLSDEFAVVAPRRPDAP